MKNNETYVLDRFRLLINVILKYYGESLRSLINNPRIYNSVWCLEDQEIVNP